MLQKIKTSDNDSVEISDPTEYTRRDFYLGNSSVRRSGSQPTQWTIELATEYERCKNDVTYFCSKYVKIINLDRGLINFEPYSYQDQMWKQFLEDRFNIVLACRQSGKTQAVVGFLLHYAIFNANQFIAIVAHEAGQAREILARITLALENLPFFLQPGCKALNKGSIQFDHNTKIYAYASNSGSLRGKSVNLLYIDEFAFVTDASKFMEATYPIITSGKTSRVIITSTANGVGNEFHRIWLGSVQKSNTYKHFRVDWWDVPGRDEAWKAETIANTSKEQFEQEFGNEFKGVGNTLIAPEILLSFVSDTPIWTGDGGVRVYEQPVKGRIYVMTVDVCKGRGKDFSTFTIFDVTEMPYRQCAVYANSLISPMYFPDLLFKWAKLYNECMAVIESNDEGASVARGLHYTLEYENVFVESFIKASGIGVFVDKKVKRIGCSRIKDVIETKKMWIRDSDTILELTNFGRKGESYEALNADVHDDLVQNLWLFGWFVGTEMFSELVGDIDLKHKMFEERIRQIEESVPFVGVFSSVSYDAQSDLRSRGYLPPGFDDDQIVDIEDMW